jgi:hypothetical protein
MSLSRSSFGPFFAIAFIAGLSVSLSGWWRFALSGGIGNSVSCSRRYDVSLRRRSYPAGDKSEISWHVAVFWFAHAFVLAAALDCRGPLSVAPLKFSQKPHTLLKKEIAGLPRYDCCLDSSLDIYIYKNHVPDEPLRRKLSVNSSSDC